MSTDPEAKAPEPAKGPKVPTDAELEEAARMLALVEPEKLEAVTAQAFEKAETALKALTISAMNNSRMVAWWNEKIKVRMKLVEAEEAINPKRSWRYLMQIKTLLDARLKMESAIQSSAEAALHLADKLGHDIGIAHDGVPGVTATSDGAEVSVKGVPKRSGRAKKGETAS